MKGNRFVGLGWRSFLLALILLLVPKPSTFAIDNTKVLEITIPRSGQHNPEFRDIVSRFVTIELERAGLVTVLEQSDDAVDIRKLFRRAAEADTAYVLTSTYDLSQTDVQMEFTWFDVASRGQVITVTRTGPVDLEFDSMVADAVGEILDATGARRERPDGLVAGVSGSSETAPLPSPTPTDPVGSPIPGSMGLAPDLSRRFVTALSISPFLVNGKTSDYFKFGFMPSFFGGYRLGLLGGRVSAGVHAGYGQFLTEGALENVQVRVMPVAGEIRYEPVTLPRFTVFTRLAVGAAVLQLDIGDGWISKMLPYGAVGIGGTRSLTESLEIAVDTSYVVMLEETTPVLGFTPTIALIGRF